MVKILRIVATTLIFAAFISASNSEQSHNEENTVIHEGGIPWKKIGGFSAIALAACLIIGLVINSKFKVKYPVLSPDIFFPYKDNPIKSSFQAAKEIKRAMEATPNYELIKAYIDNITRITEVLICLTKQACNMSGDDKKIQAGKFAVDVASTLSGQLSHLKILTNNKQLVPILEFSVSEAFKQARIAIADSQIYLAWLGDYSGQSMDQELITLALVKNTLSGNYGKVIYSDIQKVFRYLCDPTN